MQRSVIETDIYPTRYTAFDQPGKWVVFKADEDGMYRSCREDGNRLPRETLGAGQVYPGEMAILYLPEKNEDWDIEDGTCIEIGGSKRMGFTALCSHTYPTRARSQKQARISAASLEEAMARAEEWIAGL